MSATRLRQRVLAEFVGTCALVMAVVGSGVMASRLSPDDVGLQLLQNSIATGAVLVALILALQPVSAAFNPVVSVIERLHGLIDTRTCVASVAAQVVGGVLGAVLANLMFELDAVMISTKDRASGATFLAEVIATIGLVVVIFGSIRTGRTETIAYAVGGYIAAAYWFTSSTAFANPAVTVGRIFSDTFAGIAPASALPFIGAQILGGALAALLVSALYPSSKELP